MINKTSLLLLGLCGSHMAMAEELAAEPADHAVLPAMTISGSYDDAARYTVTRSTAATRFEADSLDVPQSTQVIDSRMAEDLGAVDVRDILRQVPSAFAGHTRLAPFTSFSWKIRGFDAAVTRNGFRQLYFEDVDQSALSNVERFEILKGPGAVAFGKEGLGGTINMVTKRPEKEFSGSAHVTGGEYDTKAGGFDFTGQVGDSGLALRLNGEIERSGTFVDHQDMDRDNVALTATWDEGGPVRAFLLAEYQRRDTLPYPGLPVVGTAQSNGVRSVNKENYLGEPHVDSLDTWSPLIQTWMEFDLAENWTLSPRYQHFEFNVDQTQMRLAGELAGDPTWSKRTGRYDFHERDKTDTAQLELKGKFDIGFTAHQTLMGFEVNNHRWKGDWFNYAAVPPINTLNPTYSNIPPPRVANASTFTGSIDTTESYLQDLIGIGDKVNILLGARYVRSRIESDGVPNQDDNTTPYQVGATYRFVPDWSLFAGMSTGVSVDNIVGAVSKDNSPFKPEESKQYEAGIKHQSGNLAGSLSLFHILMENVSTADPNDPDYTVQTGEQRSQGVELEAGWQATPKWYLSGGAAYLDAEITKSNDGDEGNNLGNIPHVQGNLWSHYRILPDVYWGVMGNFVGKRYGTNTNSYELSSYATMDTSLAWQIEPRLKAEVFVKNIFDREYYTGNNNFSVYPGEPRTAYARLTVNF